MIRIDADVGGDVQGSLRNVTGGEIGRGDQSTRGGKSVVSAAADGEDAVIGLDHLSVAADQQGKGVGRFAVLALANEAKSRGHEKLTVLWDAGDAGPGEFFHKLGFVDTGVTRYGETISELAL